MPTLTQLYEEYQNKSLSLSVLVAGLPVGGVITCSWEFSGFGQVPSASFEIYNPVSDTIVEGARVSIYAGFDGQQKQQFEGIIENVEHIATGARVECSGSSRKLKLLYDRIVKTLASVSASTAVAELLTDAGVTNYVVDLPAWTIGSIVTGNLEFQTYGDAVNVIAEVDGTPFYEMPDGQVRVEVRDPIPGPTAFRSYYSGKLSQLTAAQREEHLAGTLVLSAIQPEGITNSNLQPRLRSLTVGSRFSEVKNKITALGAVVTVTGTGGQQESERLEQTVFGPSPFIPTPPTYYNLTVDRPLVDDIDKLTQVAVREYSLHNRLQKVGTAAVDGDPELFLGATIYIADDDYSGETARYFVSGYRSTVSEGDFVTEISVAGGAAAGSTPSIAPVACFQWAVTGKSRQVLPVGIGPGGIGIIITYDGGCSKDFDGSIASYSWSDSEGNSGTGQFFQAAYDPALVTTVDVTLTVTDNEGNTDVLTKTVTIEDDDSGQGGQQTHSTFIFVAAEEYMIGSDDGGATWNDISRAAAGVSGKFVRVAMNYLTKTEVIALFITDTGELVLTKDVCLTSFKPQNVIDGQVLYIGGTTPSNLAEIAPWLSPSASTWIIKSAGDFYGLYILYNGDPDEDANETIGAAMWVLAYHSMPIIFPNTQKLIGIFPQTWIPEVAKQARIALSGG